MPVAKKSELHTYQSIRRVLLAGNSKTGRVIWTESLAWFFREIVDPDIEDHRKCFKDFSRIPYIVADCGALGVVYQSVSYWCMGCWYSDYDSIESGE